MKIALSGKGGSGKTTIASLLIFLYRKAGYNVFAIDADPNRHLGAALGFKEADRLTPIMDMKDLISERMNIKGLSVAPFFKLNPDLEDLPEKYSMEKDGVRLIVLGGVKGGGAGCACPENVFLKNLLHEVITRSDQVIITDMEAGLEHLGRGTAEAVDVLLIVTEPTHAGLGVAERAEVLARELGITTIFYMGNKIRSEKDRMFLEKRLSGRILGYLPYREEMIEGEQDEIPSYERGAAPELLREVEAIRLRLEEQGKTAKNAAE